MRHKSDTPALQDIDCQGLKNPVLGTAACITLVEDNLSAHRRAALYEVFEAERARSILKRIEFIATPKHDSWLNMAEISVC